MIPSAVVDASVALKWLVPEPDSARARALSRRLHAPDLLLAECANALWRKARAGDLAPSEAHACLARLLEAPVSLTAAHELLSQALELALELNRPIYDCVYVALAMARGIPLVTADRRLSRAVRAHKLPAPLVLLSELPV